MVAHILNHSTQEAKVGKSEFEDWSIQGLSDPTSINKYGPTKFQPNGYTDSSGSIKWIIKPTQKS